MQDTNYKRSALYYASSSGLESIVAKLLSLGADVALKDKDGFTACSTHFSTHFPIVLQIVHPNRARKSCSCTNVAKASLGAI